VFITFVTGAARNPTPEATDSSPVALSAPPPAPPPPPIRPMHRYHPSPGPPAPPPPAPPPPRLPSAIGGYRLPPLPPRGIVQPPSPPPLPPRNILRTHHVANPPPPPAPPPIPVARSPTPPMVTMLMEMGFERPVARIAVERCENFDSSRPPDENIDVLLNWILDHPDAVADEERR